jgi:hypothetical protein
MTDQKVKYRLKGHEKFSLRDGWLNKGINILNEEYNNIFLEKHNTDNFGVGSNMVKSIRHWLRVFNLSVESPGHGTKLSKLGSVIKKNDIYLEDNFTLWILHSNLVKNKEEATVWYMFFNMCDVNEFDKEEIFKKVYRELYKYVGNSDFSSQSVKDDIDVLLNMYGKEKGKDIDPEDKNISPMAALGLIKKSQGRYFRKQPDIRILNEWVILYELCCMFEKSDSLSIDRIAEGERSLGSIYGLTRINVNKYLDKLEARGFIKVDRTAGLDMVYPIESIYANEVIEKYYNEHK